MYIVIECGEHTLGLKCDEIHMILMKFEVKSESVDCLTTEISF